jgi:hypothetical protein
MAGCHHRAPKKAFRLRDMIDKSGPNVINASGGTCGTFAAPKSMFARATGRHLMFVSRAPLATTGRMDRRGAGTSPRKPWLYCVSTAQVFPQSY